MKQKTILQFSLRAAIIGGIILFFVRQFQENWSVFRTFTLQFHPVYILSAFFLLTSVYPFLSYVWYTAMNTLSEQKKISFQETLVITNLTSLTKYLPGKVWSYSLQIVWLGQKGFRKILVLYVNILLIILTVTVSMWIGLLYLSYFTRMLSAQLSLFFLAVMLTGNFFLSCSIPHLSQEEYTL